MKHLLTVLLLSIASLASAQIVNIPDPAFRQFLLDYWQVIDTNGDGQIQVSEAEGVTELYIDDFSGYYINDLTGVKAFKNLQTLNTFNLRFLTQVDVSDLALLRDLYLENSRIGSVNVANCTSLENLGIDNIGANEDSVNSLNVNGTPHLRELYCDQFNFQELDLSHCDSLVNVSFGLGRIQGILNVSGLTILDRMSFEGKIGTIYAANAKKLKKVSGVSVDWTGIYVDEMNFDNCNSLEEIINVNYNGTDLDLSSCYNLWMLSIYGANLRTLNLKNGLAFVHYTHVNVVNTNPNPLPLYVCVDDSEADKVITSLVELNGAGFPFTVNSFCTPAPGGIYNTINGKVKWDADANGCDAADAGRVNIPVRIFDGTNYVVSYTSPAGDYVYHRPAGNFTLASYFPSPFYNTSPSSASVIFDTANNLVDSANFCIAAAGTHDDVEISIVPLSPARAGFSAYYQLFYKNRGTTLKSGSVQFNYDNSKMSFNSATPLINTQSPGMLVWNYSNLAPFESRIIQVRLELSPPPVNNITDTLFYLAAITPVTGDATPADNSFVLPQKITGSYDPNDKACLQGEKIDISKIGDYLHYIIRFQNLGNDTAFNVVVTDTLSGNLDWESFDLIGTSHICNVKRADNKLEFYFQNIQLPYSAVNEAGSHGFVAFKIRPKNSLIPGDSLNNRASIYFDFNPAVVTNTVSTVVSFTSGPVPVKLEYFSLSSKDQGNLLTWKLTTADQATTFFIERSNDGIHFSSIGSITATEQRCLLPFNFTDDKPFAKNHYRLKITGADGVFFYSKILVTGNTKSGFEIRAISSNQNNTILYVEASTDQVIQMKLIASDGRVIYSQNKTVAAGMGYLNLQTKSLAAGIYTIVVNTDERKVITKRFVK